MPNLLSGAKLRTGGSGQFIKLQDAMPQLPPSPTTSTGYTLITDDKLVSRYASSLGNIEFINGQVFSNLTTTNLTIIGTGTTSVVIKANNPVSSTSTLIVQGGQSIFGSLLVAGDLQATTSTFTTLKVTSTQTSVDAFTGALQVVGGLGVGENLNVFGKLVVLNTATFGKDLIVNKNVTVYGELNAIGNQAVTLSPQAANVNIQPSIGGSVLIQPSQTGAIENMTIGYYVPQDGYFQTLHSSNLTVTNIVWAGTSITTKDGYFQTVHSDSLTVTNTAWIGESITTKNGYFTESVTATNSVYSQEGIAEYGNLLYTPRITISTTAPVNPRVGDFWINPTYGVECQYINDGGNYFWIQFTGF